MSACILLLKRLPEDPLEETQGKLHSAEFKFTRLVRSVRAGRDAVPSARCDYGFDNLRMYHRNVPADVESILLGIYQAIRWDILQSEYGDPTEALLYPLLNDFGASKQMILEAYESNSLDAFIQRFVRNALQRRGDACPRYFSDWLHYRLIIGPTRLLLSEEEVLSARDIARMREEIYRTYYE